MANIVGVTLLIGIICSKSKLSWLNLCLLSAYTGSVVHYQSVFSRWLEGNLRRVVPPHPGFPALLFQLQRAQFLLPAFLAVPQLLTVLVHAQTVGPHHGQVFVALQRELLRMLEQPRVPVSRQGRRWMRGPWLPQKPSDHYPGRPGPPVVWTVVLQVAGWVEAVVGDDVNAVSGQDLAVGVLVAGAGVEACVSQLQALNQQPPLHVEGAVVIALRELRGGQRGWCSSCQRKYKKAAEPSERVACSSSIITGKHHPNHQHLFPSDPSLHQQMEKKAANVWLTSLLLCIWLRVCCWLSVCCCIVHLSSAWGDRGTHSRKVEFPSTAYTSFTSTESESDGATEGTI